MRLITGILLTLMMIGPSAAARPDARAMSCERAQQMVLNRGAVVMTTGKYTYQRFVSRRSYCDYWEVTRSAWTATRDDPKCRIGYICEQRMDDDGFRRFRWLNRR
ncbi:MAG TPA: hypothetical protein VKN63_09040 [Afifellaceae bacterium]|nr:hypothetical protein [Afifellaceae bacterium]